MGLAESALILLGIGIVSSRFEAGKGLGELGAGIQTLVAAPLTGTGTGLSTFAGGLRDVFETFGDLGRGLGALFENIPKLPQQPPGNGNGQQLERAPIYTVSRLVQDSGGSSSSLLSGGGGNVSPPTVSRPPPPLVERRDPRPPSVDLRPISVNDGLRPVMM